MRAQKLLIGHGSHLIVSQQPHGGGTVALIWFRVGARPGRTRIYALSIVASHLTLTGRTATHIHCNIIDQLYHHHLRQGRVLSASVFNEAYGACLEPELPFGIGPQNWRPSSYKMNIASVPLLLRYTYCFHFLSLLPIPFLESGRIDIRLFRRIYTRHNYPRDGF